MCVEFLDLSIIELLSKLLLIAFSGLGVCELLLLKDPRPLLVGSCPKRGVEE